MTAEDGLLAQRARDGDQRAFAELVRRHQDRVFRFVLRMTGSRDESMDLTQDTFMKAWQALSRWEPRIALKAVTVEPGDDPALVLISITYALVRTGRVDNLVYPYLLRP